MVGAGLYEQALAAALKIKNEDSRTNVLTKMFENLVQVERYDLALNAAAEVKDACYRAQALTKISVAMARAGLREQAEHAVEQSFAAALEIGEATQRTKAFAGIARVLSAKISTSRVNKSPPNTVWQLIMLATMAKDLQST